MVATYACKDIQSYNLHYHVCHEEGNSLLGRFLLYHLSSLHTETKSVKKGQLHMIALMSCKQMSIIDVSVVLLQ